MKPLVSIILPVYNVELYLSQCLNSVLQQTYDKYELIAIDDGSTDRSLEILEAFRKKFSSRLIIHQQVNSGVAVARNKGLAMARGEYLYFLDSDDWIASNTLELCVELLEKEKADLILFDAEAFSDGIDDEFKNWFNYHRNLPGNLYYGNRIFADSINNNYIITPCCYLFRRSAYENLRFIPGILHEDNYFTTMVFVRSKKTVVLKDKLFNRRFRPNSIMTMNKTYKHAQGYHRTIKALNEDLNSEDKKNIKKELRMFFNRLLRNGVEAEISARGQLSVKRKMVLLLNSFEFIDPSVLIFLVSQRCHGFIKKILQILMNKK